MQQENLFHENMCVCVCEKPHIEYEADIHAYIS